MRITEQQYNDLLKVKGYEENETFSSYSENRFNIVNQAGDLIAIKSVIPFITEYFQFG